MIDLDRIRRRREKAKELVSSYCLDSGIELREKKMRSGMTSVVVNDRAFHSMVEENAWVFALSFLELEMKAKFEY